MGNKKTGFVSGARVVPLVIITLLFGFLSSCEDILGDQDVEFTREMLVDTWKVEETHGVYKSEMEVYWVEISLHPMDTSKIIIYNFYNVDADAEAILTSGKNLELKQQTLQGGYTVAGSGQVQGSRGNEIIWSYSVDDGSGVPDNVSAIYTRLTF